MDVLTARVVPAVLEVTGDAKCARGNGAGVLVVLAA